MATSDRLKCPTCDFQMIHISRPLMRIFGDVRAFQCQPCNSMFLLRHPFKLLTTEETIGPTLDAA